MLLENENAVVHGAGGAIGSARLRPGGGHWLAHVANHEGLIAADHMAGKDPAPLDPNLVPHVTFCRPEIASFGLTEDRTRERDQDVKIGRFPFRAVGKALIEGEPGGFVKIVSDARFGLILGVLAVGRYVTELISEGCSPGWSKEPPERWPWRCTRTRPWRRVSAKPRWTWMNWPLTPEDR